MEAYISFVRQVADKRNRLSGRSWSMSGAAFGRCRLRRCPEYVTYRTKVRKWSTVRVANRTYTVPSG